MFVRSKTTEGRTYLQVVESYWQDGKPHQRIIATLGRLDKLTDHGSVDGILKSLSRFSDKVRVHEEYKAGNLEAKDVLRIGPDLILSRLWEELGIKKILKDLAKNTNYGFSLERAVYLSTLSRLFFPGSDRKAKRITRDYKIPGASSIELHQLYRAMTWLGGKRQIIEEALFAENKNLFSKLSVVFFDTTSLYFEGGGGDTLGRRGYSKDRRPDEAQMVVGAVLDEVGRPIAAPMWPGNTTDAKTLIPVASSLKERFGVGKVTFVADRGMVGKNNIKELQDKGFSYILGVKMRLEKKAMREVLSRGGRFKEVTNNLKVKEVLYEKKRYIICLNVEQKKKDITDREIILSQLKDKLKTDASKLIGNNGYRRYLKVEKGSVSINETKIKDEARYDGKWVLITNTDMPAKEVALKYKDLWQVEAVFRSAKSLLQTRPIFHRIDDAILGHVFVSFLAIVLLKELKSRVDFAFEWDRLRQDLDCLYEIKVVEDGKAFLLRSPLQGSAGKVFKAVGVAIPPNVKEA